MKFSIILFLLFAIIPISKAQEVEPKEEENVYSEKVTVVAPYEPTISDAFKLNDFPVIVDSISTRPLLEYNIKARQLPVSFSAEPIKPARIIQESLSKLYRGYIKGGFGNYVTPYGEIAFNGLRSKKLHFGAYGKHHSSAGNVKNYAPSAFSNNNICLFGRSFSKTSSWHGKMNYDRNVLHYYGYKPDQTLSVIDEKDILQKISSIGINIGTKSTYTDTTRLNYDVSFYASSLTDYHKTDEVNLGSKMNINQTGVFIKQFKGAQEVGVDIKADYFGTTVLNNEYNHGLIKVSPYARSWFNNLRVSLGFNTYIIGDTLSTLDIKPYIDLRLNLVKDILYIYGGATGGYERNKFRDLIYENPYMNSNPALGFTYTKIKAYGGFNGSFSSKMSYNTGISMSVIKNMPFFVSDTTTSLINNIPFANSNKFDIITDDVELIHAHAELSYLENDKIRIILKGNFYQYNMANELKAWHKPTMDAIFTMNYNLKSKIILKTDIIYYNSIYARTYDQTGIVNFTKLDDILDLNIGIEYRYTKLISAFVNVNNIGASRYSRWYNYPNQGINVLGGFTFCF